MKKFILLFVLFILSTGCVFFESANYRECIDNEEDDLSYNWITKEPCTALNKKAAREDKRLEREYKRIEKRENKDLERKKKKAQLR